MGGVLARTNKVSCWHDKPHPLNKNVIFIELSLLISKGNNMTGIFGWGFTCDIFESYNWFLNVSKENNCTPLEDLKKIIYFEPRNNEKLFNVHD